MVCYYLTFALLNTAIAFAAHILAVLAASMVALAAASLVDLATFAAASFVVSLRILEAAHLAVVASSVADLHILEVALAVVASSMVVLSIPCFVFDHHVVQLLQLSRQLL